MTGRSFFGARRGLIALFGGLALAACGGAETGSDGGTAETIEPGTRFFDLTDFPPLEALTSADVQQVIAQAVNEADAQGAPATIAVVDRVGNVLAVFQMTGADPNLRAIAETPRRIDENEIRAIDAVGADGSGLDGLAIPQAAPLGAIAKAVTGAYLSSGGNAFTTRTASQIVQENFNPEEFLQAGGPLFGVQFSQLACSDLSTRFESDNGAGTVVGSTVGPRRSPLGLAADPGGLPLYKNGVMVGGIGVISDGVYGIDLSIVDRDSDLEIQDELIALAGTTGFEPPESIKAFRITVEGNTLRYTDTTDDTDRLQATTPAADFATLLGGAGALIDVNGYYDVPAAPGTEADVLAGTAYGDPASGYVPASTLPGGSPFANPNAFVLVDDAGNPRFSPKAANDAPNGDASIRLTEEEVTTLIDEALGVALAGRAQIRQPFNSRIQVTVSVVDTNGEILGIARTPDGPIFGTDVSLQKARTAMFFSSAEAATDLDDFPEVVSSDFFGQPNFALEAFGGFIPDPDNGDLQAVTLASGQSYVDAARAFIGPDALTGLFAFSDRGNGNLSRPFFPDGVQEQNSGTPNPNGPFSRPFNSDVTADNWSPFSTGLQFDIVGANILQHVLFTLRDPLGIPAASAPDTPVGCGLVAVTPPGAPITNANLLPARDPLVFPRPALANGAQIFAGSVPIYRNGVLIGGIGVSGDGIDQDDMISSLGLRRAGLFLGNGLGHAPEDMRSDSLIINGTRLRYVSCPFEPFIESDIQNACETL